MSKDYEIYKLRWMIEHDYTLSDLIKALDNYKNECDYRHIPLIDIFKEWEEYIGFPHQTLYVCEDEFNDNEKYQTNISQLTEEQLIIINNKIKDLKNTNKTIKENNFGKIPLTEIPQYFENLGFLEGIAFMYKLINESEE